MKIDFKSARKTTWIFNALLFNICRFFPFRRKNLWIFGAREGHNFDDNSRYMYEFICKYHSDKIKAIWISRDKNIVDEVNKLGYLSYSCGSLKGIIAELRAGVVFYTNGLIDFGVFPLIGGSKVVALWHGVGCKKIYNSGYSQNTRKIKEIMDIFFSWTYRNITIATSIFSKEIFKDIFSIKNEGSIFITGQPRNDVFKNLRKDGVLKNLNIDFNKKLILYMPTYRGPATGKYAMADIVIELYNNKLLDKTLTENNYIFIAKLHPLTSHIFLPERKNFKILDYKAVESNQALLGVGDMLLTDYSRACIDFASLT